MDPGSTLGNGGSIFLYFFILKCSGFNRPSLIVRIVELFYIVIPGESSSTRFLTALTVADSYTTTLPHAEDSVLAFAVSTA